MGWGNGQGKSETINKAVGSPVDIDMAAEHPFRDRYVLVDGSGWGHKASKQQAKEVALFGISEGQKGWVSRQLDALSGERAKIVLVMDGRAYPAKAAVRERRKQDKEGQLTCICHDTTGPASPTCQPQMNSNDCHDLLL